MKFLLVVLLCFQTADTLSGQQNEQKSDTKDSAKKISVREIEGTWFTSDSTGLAIQFIQEGNGDVYLEGIRHGISRYSFLLEKDSMSTQGVAINWPPYYCRLHLINPGELEIMFYHVGSGSGPWNHFRRHAATPHIKHDQED